MKKPSPKSSQQGRNGQELYTLNPIEEPEQSASESRLPVWIRLPKPGRLCPFTGLTRSGMNTLVLGGNPPVRSVSLRKRYAVRGVRLVHLDSLLAYIEAMANSQNINQ